MDDEAQIRVAAIICGAIVLCFGILFGSIFGIGGWHDNLVSRDQATVALAQAHECDASRATRLACVQAQTRAKVVVECTAAEEQSAYNAPNEIPDGQAEHEIDECISAALQKISS